MFLFISSAFALCPSYPVTGSDGVVVTMKNKLEFTEVDETTVDLTALEADGYRVLPLAGVHGTPGTSLTACPLYYLASKTQVREVVVANGYIIADGITPTAMLLAGTVPQYFDDYTQGSALPAFPSGKNITFTAWNPAEDLASEGWDLVLALQEEYRIASIWQPDLAWGMMWMMARQTEIKARFQTVTYTDGTHTVTVNTGTSFGDTYTIP